MTNTLSALKELLDSFRLAAITEREKGFIRTTEAINYEDLIRLQ